MTFDPFAAQPVPQRLARWQALALAAVLVLAAWFRFYQLGDVPPGLTHDEANNAHDAAGVLAGVRPLYFATGYGHEPLYNYLTALISLPCGVSDVSLRLTTTLCGLGVLLGSYLLARRAFDLWLALAAAAGLALSFWPVFSQRQGVRPVTLPLLFAPAAFLVWRGLSPSGRRSDWALAGLLIGGSFYTYLACRVLLFVWPAFAVYLALFHRAAWRRGWRGLLAAALIAALVAAPLAIYLVTHPEQEIRLEQLNAPLIAARQGNLRPLLDNLLGALKVFSISGDTHWRYNLPGRPIFDPLTSVFLYLGLALALWRWRQPACAFLLLWLGAGLSPGLITGAMNSSQRTMGAQPAVYITLALGITQAGRWLWARGRPARWMAVLGGAALLGGNAWLAFHDYFVTWAAEPDVREVYHTNLRQIARYLDGQAESGLTAISTRYPQAFHDPYVLEAILYRQDLLLRWFDGRGALVAPQGGAGARYVFPAAAALHPALQARFVAGAAPLAVVHLRPDDLNPSFSVYRLTLAGRLTPPPAPVGWSSATTFAPDGSDPLRRALDWPVNLGDKVLLLGYELEGGPAAPRAGPQLLTYWRVLAQPAAPAQIFVHLLDADSQVRGGQDRLDAPTAHWQPGDVIVQVHELTLDAGLSPGVYPLEIGVYDVPDLARWPVLADGAAVADRLLLQPVEVGAP